MFYQLYVSDDASVSVVRALADVHTDTNGVLCALMTYRFVMTEKFMPPGLREYFSLNRVMKNQTYIRHVS